jgi:hypothetical protein
MKTAVIVVPGLLAGALGFVWLMTRLRYHISRRHVKITLLGICLRRIALEDIHYVTKRRPNGWTEHWWNTIQPKHRTLVIRRYRGLCRNVEITPRNRYVFKTDLERAIKRTEPPAEDAPENIPVISD